MDQRNLPTLWEPCLRPRLDKEGLPLKVPVELIHELDFQVIEEVIDKFVGYFVEIDNFDCIFALVLGDTALDCISRLRGLLTPLLFLLIDIQVENQLPLARVKPGHIPAVAAIAVYWGGYRIGRLKKEITNEQ